MTLLALPTPAFLLNIKTCPRESKMTPVQNRICQISLALSTNKPENDNFVFPAQAEKTTRQQEREVNIKSLEAPCLRLGWPHDAHLQSCPHPMRMNEQHTDELRELHEALVLAINNIIERWWRDEEAEFSKRMPLEAHEELLLQVSNSRGQRAQGQSEEYKV